ncbi:MAG: Crp/Fnr family transcriptional regulator [Granulosicoccus sp.]
MSNNSLNTTQRSEAAYQFKKNALFSSLDDAAFTRLLDNVQLRSLNEGETLFEQNDAAVSIFMLQSGQIKLLRLSAAGNEKIIELIAPGQSFAEAVMFSESDVYPVSAVALRDTKVWCVDAHEYSGLLRTSYDACFSVMAEQSRRLHQLIAEIDSLTLHGAVVRLVSYLLVEADNSEDEPPVVNLPHTKVVLASRLSIKPETLSRTFARLSKEQLVQIEDRRIKLLNVERLKQLQLTG